MTNNKRKKILNNKIDNGKNDKNDINANDKNGKNGINTNEFTDQVNEEVIVMKGI